MRRLLPALTVTALLLGTAVTPADAATRNLAAHVSAVGHPTAGHPATFAFRTAGAAHYSVSFGDHSKSVAGKHGPATRISHTYGRAGWYTVALTVTRGAKSATSKTKVLVLSPAGATASPVTAATSPAAAAAVPFAAAAPNDAVSPRTTSNATVSMFTPTSGPVHTAVTINGANFTYPATATFAGVSSPATVVNSSTITTTLPTGAGTGPLVVTTNGGPITVGTFTATVGLITSTSIGQPTSVVTVVGSGYAANEDLTFYVGSTQAATGVSIGNGTFSKSLTIPASIQPGVTQINVTGQHSSLAAQTQFTVQTDWATAGFSTGGTGYNPFENTLNVGNVSALTRSFFNPSANSGGGVVVAKGIAYFADTNKYIHAVNAATGAQVWAAQLFNPIATGIAVANGNVYVGDSRGDFYSLNAAYGSGSVLFSGATMSFNGSPAVASNIVYVGNDDDNLYAINTTSGSLVWKFATGNAVDSSPSVAGGVVFFGSNDKYVYAVNATTGARIWSDQTAGVIQGDLPVVNGRVYVASDKGDGTGTLTAIETFDGSYDWSNAVSGPGSLAVANSVVYYADNRGTLTAESTYDGSTMWTMADSSSFLGAPAVANGVVYVNDFSAIVTAVNATTGARLWSAAGGSYGFAQPVVANGTLYSTSEAGLSAYTLAPTYTANG